MRTTYTKHMETSDYEHITTWLPYCSVTFHKLLHLFMTSVTNVNHWHVFLIQTMVWNSELRTLATWRYSSLNKKEKGSYFPQWRAGKSTLHSPQYLTHCRTLWSPHPSPLKVQTEPCQGILFFILSLLEYIRSSLCIIS